MIAQRFGMKFEVMWCRSVAINQCVGTYLCFHRVTHRYVCHILLLHFCDLIVGVLRSAIDFSMNTILLRKSELDQLGMVDQMSGEGGKYLRLCEY